MEPDILNKLFAEELGESEELINDYYGSFIEDIEEPDDIKVFAETLAEELRQDYGGKLSEDERSKFHYALMFNSMTIAWKRMLKHQIQEGEEEEFIDEDDLDITKGLVSNEHYTKMLEGLDVHAGAEVKMASKYGFIDKSGKVVIEPQFDNAEPFSEGLACVEKDGKWGFIDKSGKMVIEPQFDGASDFSEGLAKVKR